MADQFNPNIPLQVHTQPSGLSNINPLQMLGSMAQLQGAANQNALFQQEFAARQALGPIFQQATSPEGHLDTKKVMQGIAGSPAAAFKAPEVLQALVQKELTAAQITEKDLTNARLWNQNFATSLTGTLGNPTFKSADLDKVVVGALAEIPGKEERQKFATKAAQILAGLPKEPGEGADPRSWDQWRQGVRNAAKPILAQTQATQEALDVTLGVLGQTDLGSSIVGTRKDPLTGRIVDAGGEAGFLPKDLTPGEKATPVTVPRASGAQEVMPTSKFVAQGTGGAGEGFVSSPPALVKGQEDAQGKLQEYAKSLSEQVADYQSTVDNMRLSWQSAQPNWTGPGAEALAGFAKALSAMGVPKEGVNAIMDLGKYQTLEKSTVRRAMNELMASVQGSGSRIAQQEYMNFKDTAAGINTTRDAMKTLFDFTQTLANKAMLKQKMLNAYLQKEQGNPNRSINEFESKVWTPALEHLGKLKYREADNAR